MEHTLDALEKRLTALELQILPDPNQELDITKLTPIIDCLMQAHGMIGTALSCRESVANILRFLPQISEWLDPVEFEIAAERKQYILDLHPELEEGIRLLDEFGKYREVLESNYFSSVNDLTDRVDRLTISALNTRKESECVTQKVLDDLRMLQDVTKSFKTLFAQLEFTMDALEETVKPKQTIDE